MVSVGFLTIFCFVDRYKKFSVDGHLRATNGDTKQRSSGRGRTILEGREKEVLLEELVRRPDSVSP